MAERDRKYLFLMDIKNYSAGDAVFSRPSMRAVIEADPDHLYLVYSTKKKFYKFPGGGAEQGESAVQTLVREVKEETGLTVDPDTVKEFGSVLRIQKSTKDADTVFRQENTYFTCRLIDNIKEEQQLDAYEAEDGFTLRIVSYQDAIAANRQCKGLNDIELCMIERDTRVLEILDHQEQVPGREMAKFLIREAEKKNPGKWVQHSYHTAECAQQIAEGCTDMDPEKAYVLGLLHDIGRREGITGIAHVYDGYHYLKDLGYESAARIALTHSFALKRLDEYVGIGDLNASQIHEMQALLDSITFDDYDRLIQLCDAMATAEKITTVEERMNDVKQRYGFYPQEKWDKNLELRDYFEEKMKRKP